MMTITSSISSSSESFPDFCSSSFFSPSSSGCVSVLESSELSLLLTLIDIHIATAYHVVKEQDKKKLQEKFHHFLNFCLHHLIGIILWYLSRFGLWYFMPLSTIFQLYCKGSVLLMEETRVPAENHRPVTSHWQTLSHNVVSSTPPHKRGSNSQL